MAELVSTVEHGEQLAAFFNDIPIVKAKFEKNGWQGKFRHCGDMVDFETRTKMGSIIGIERAVTTSDPTGLYGEYIQIWQRYDNPNIVAIVSNNAPQYIKSSRKNYEKVIGDAIKIACANPGYFKHPENTEREDYYRFPLKIFSPPTK